MDEVNCLSVKCEVAECQLSGQVLWSHVVTVRYGALNWSHLDEELKSVKFEQGQMVKLRPSILKSLLSEDINKVQEIDIVIQIIYLMF